jgi:predicted  nucleic acid-binding Zn-ribbon protein
VRASQNSTGHAAGDQNCRVVITQFVEAVTARQAAATCQDGASRQRTLEMLDAEIQTFNDRIAEQSWSITPLLNSYHPKSTLRRKT